MEKILDFKLAITVRTKYWSTIYLFPIEVLVLFSVLEKSKVVLPKLVETGLVPNSTPSGEWFDFALDHDIRAR